MKMPPTKCLAVDVDGTLVVNGKLNTLVSDYARRKLAAGFEVILWSARGKAYAETQADKFGVRDCFSVIISKPGFIVDDRGWSWIKYTIWIRGAVIRAWLHDQASGPP